MNYKTRVLVSLETIEKENLVYYRGDGHDDIMVRIIRVVREGS